MYKPFVSWRALKPISTFYHVIWMHKYCLKVSKPEEKLIENWAFCKKRELYLNQFSNKEGAIGKPERPKRHPIWAANPPTHLSTKYPRFNDLEDKLKPEPKQYSETSHILITNSSACFVNTSLSLDIKCGIDCRAFLTNININSMTRILIKCLPLPNNFECRLVRVRKYPRNRLMLLCSICVTTTNMSIDWYHRILLNNPMSDLNLSNIVNKKFNSIKYTTYIWSYRIKYEYYMTERVV